MLSDEWNHYDVPVVPWSDFLPDFFKKMKGYDMPEEASAVVL